MDAHVTYQKNTLADFWSMGNSITTALWLIFWSLGNYILLYHAIKKSNQRMTDKHYSKTLEDAKAIRWH